jgi:hypothetical protein
MGVLVHRKVVEGAHGKERRAHRAKLRHSARRRNYSPYAKGNFCFERVISGWRGALTVLDLRLKK